MAKFLIIGFCISALGAGCRSLGPPTVPRDRFDYSSAISDSSKSQLLLNMVKIRYGDIGVFVEVSSIISQYALENNVNYNFSWEYPPTFRTPSMGGSSRFEERPTITYSPMTGEKFTKSLLTPIPPSAIFFLIQSGKSVDNVLYLCVQSINGINNHYDGPQRSIPINPDFTEVLTRLSRMQKSGMVGMRIQMVENNPNTVFFFPKGASAEIEQDVSWLKKKLGLNPQVSEFKVVYASVPEPNEIAIMSRSVSEVLVQIAASIEIPEDDLKQNRAYAVTKTDNPLAERLSVHIRSGKEKPTDAFVSILYRGKWFWIDDTDFRSKQIFSSLMILLSLMESDKGANQPLITVPTG